ncbi:hypothetical protein P0O24_07060 [Methanotrichaceae archaeon M04Ac]|uniref:Uncharacterized protein n=1 Tax=Candidatus Methanocrinis alkalitolerans TaxID=3033395 RepID=A0ABT5XFD2_9EURY|nr:hypothetical protein [Candidatus Methanocrinis alkalitolerans]MDF0593338.1 hypothetical protein [Candidatus Methanocrinis alkalitolerans]
MNQELPFSDHREMMNAVLGLAYNLRSYPNHLHKAGYRISRIEPRFKLNVSQTLNPDIIFMSNDHVLIAECKSAAIKSGKNIKNYGNITERHLSEKGIDIIAENPLFDVAIFGNSNIKTLTYILKKNGVSYPQVEIDKIIQKKFGNAFKDTDLESLFSKAVIIKGKPPNIIKFDNNSTPEDIAPYVIQDLMQRVELKRTVFKTRDLAKEIFEAAWDDLDETFKDELRKKIDKFLRTYCKTTTNKIGKKSRRRKVKKMPKLDKYLSKNDDIWTINVKDHWKSKDAFRKDCIELMKYIKRSPARKGWIDSR